MSCIAGILNLDGGPVDGEMLERMTAAMSARAPDGCRVWCAGNVGFGHAMLRVSTDVSAEDQPFTLDGQVWITADARIDGRADLLKRLRLSGEEMRGGASDAEILLHAYRAFGESFQEHVIGDFAFAIWDGRDKKLLCARDHFGVRPLFFAKTTRVFVFASDISAILEHSEVIDVHCEAFMADFLLFGLGADDDLTAYRDIYRLPRASRISVTQDRVRTQRYWTLPLHSELRYKDDTEYLDQSTTGSVAQKRLPSNSAVAWIRAQSPPWRRRSCMLRAEP